MGAFMVNTEALLEVTGRSNVTFVESYVENGTEWEAYDHVGYFNIQHAGGDTVTAKIFFDVSFESNGDTYVKFVEYSLQTPVSAEDLPDIEDFLDHQVELLRESMISGDLD